MIDREKVIGNLTSLRERLKWQKDIQGYGVYISFVDDAIDLLKEQEAIMIKTVMINGSGRNGRCQNCLMMLNEMDYPNFCGNCGQAVKWE